MQWLAVFAITARQLFGEMHCITHRTAITAAVDTIAVGKCRHEQRSSIGDFLNVGVVAHKCRKHLLAGGEGSVDVLFQGLPFKS